MRPHAASTSVTIMDAGGVSLSRFFFYICYDRINTAQEVGPWYESC